MTNNVLWDEVNTFFASGPSVDEIIQFRPSDSANERVMELLEKN